MAQLPSFVVFILSCALVVHGQNLANLLTIQPGTTNGGCGARTADLNQYATESLQSVQVAINAIRTHGGANTANGRKVRRALDTFFKISPSIQRGQNGRDKIATNLEYVRTWFTTGFPEIPPDETFLFCDSSFLVRHAVTDQAQDYQGNGITQNGQNVPISTAYATKLTGQNVPWWAGTHTTANGYYFTAADSGGNYCNTDGRDGLTAILDLYVADPNGAAKKHAVYSTILLCPGSFDNPDKPATWPAGSNQIRQGHSLQTALPKCMTLLHEAFHLIFGVGPPDGMLEGSSEFYTLAECINRRKSASVLRTNPENYVFFIASMYYLFGTAPAIPENWDFTNRPDSAQR
ncbi:hypothetical protein BT63DRAFT_461465 [Microthyrium microscopicum]|uniref:Lysine-specific metallo-endopeptidase domain-containing protein n=1 Tax=Microthyrium microscopicum TaxID=703497 RepID=A0A6A6TV78_9PEZI|nr:hypothetical protein BT63DRAFT_461465 [Microthyrium microscopicum]